MWKKTDEVKVMRDPVHGYIHVELQVVWDCINAKEFQRLRRIHQLGGDFQVYHTAEHTRFAHSLGVYEIVRRMCEEIRMLKETLSDYEKTAVMLAGLLHDIGHGPFSHAFEAVSSCRHESYTARIILEDTQIHQILKDAHPSLPHDVASIIQDAHPNDLLNQMISGQLDADRMDYLLRDAYFTGTSYGTFDLERIIRTMRIQDQKLVVKESGIHSVEDYIMARYHMYWQVYLHPVARSFEGLLSMLFQRMKDVYESDPELMVSVPMFHPFLTDQEVSVNEHFLLDEAAANYGFSCLRTSADPVLKDLAIRLLDRHLFAYTSMEAAAKQEAVIKQVEALGYPAAYYIYEDVISQKAYSPYKHSEQHKNIWVLKKDGEVKELSEISDIVRAISSIHGKEDKKLYYPETKLECET